MLSSLLLARRSILSCFFFFFFVKLTNSLFIFVVKEVIKVQLALAIPTGAPMTVVKEIIDTPPLVAERAIKLLSM